MDQQVSPAVVIIVLVLIVAILVGLYFLVVERGPAALDDEIMNDVFDEDPADLEGEPPGTEVDPEGDNGVADEDGATSVVDEDGGDI